MPKHSSKAGKSLVIDIEGGSLVELNPWATGADRVSLMARVEFSAEKWESIFSLLSPPTRSLGKKKRKKRKENSVLQLTRVENEMERCKPGLFYILNGQINVHTLFKVHGGGGGGGRQEKRDRGGTSLSKVGQLKIFLLPFCFSVSDMSKARPTNVTAAVMPCGSLRASTIHLHLVAKRSRLSVYKGPTCTQSL